MAERSSAELKASFASGTAMTESKMSDLVDTLFATRSIVASWRDAHPDTGYGPATYPSTISAYVAADGVAATAGGGTQGFCLPMAMPHGYTGGTVTVRLSGTCVTGNGGNAVLYCAAALVVPGASGATTAAYQQSVPTRGVNVGAIGATASAPAWHSSGTVTPSGTWAQGGTLHLFFGRLAGDPSDTHDSDLSFRSVAVDY